MAKNNCRLTVEEKGSMVYTAKGIPPVKNTIFGVMTYAALGWPDGSLLTPEEVAGKAMDERCNIAPTRGRIPKIGHGSNQGYTEARAP
jgi:hypothetical protein